MGEVTERVVSGPENGLGYGAFADEMAAVAEVHELALRHQSPTAMPTPATWRRSSGC